MRTEFNSFNKPFNNTLLKLRVALANAREAGKKAGLSERAVEERVEAEVGKGATPLKKRDDASQPYEPGAWLNPTMAFYG